MLERIGAFRAPSSKSRVRRAAEEYFSKRDLNESPEHTLENAEARAPRSVHASRRPILLGIDPGTLAVGYGAVVAAERGPRFLAAGVLRAERRASVPERLGWIQSEIVRVLEKVRPTIVVVEAAFAARNVRSALRIGEGRGVALACAAAFGAEVVEYAPAVAKKALIGHGAADKGQVARMVLRLLNTEELELPLDATDALALALAHWQRSRWTSRR
jgi:crossover junction endodeoxyribonuclease RuvC